MYCTSYHMTNHNVETCRIKRKEDLVPIVFEVTTQHIKVQTFVRYSCHICGNTKHKFIESPKYINMKIKNKGTKPIDKQVVVEPKVSIL
jgi:hypothetical protein